MTKLHVCLPDQLRKKLDGLSERTGLKLAEIVRQALIEYLKDDGEGPNGKPYKKALSAMR